MVKHLNILFLGFIAGLAGNLLAAWIQQDLWTNFFSTNRIITTFVLAGLALATVAWLENRPTLPLSTRKVSNRLASSTANIKFDALTQDVYDVFISYCSPDRSSFVRPLAEILERKGLRIWYDEFELQVGDSIRQSTDRGLANANFGIVVISQSFFNDKSVQRELNALFAKELTGRKVILPIWHNIEFASILEQSPLLADRYALNSQKMTKEEIAKAIIEVVCEPRNDRV